MCVCVDGRLAACPRVAACSSGSEKGNEWVVTNGGYKLTYCINGNDPLSLVITGQGERESECVCVCVCVRACMRVYDGV